MYSKQEISSLLAKKRLTGAEAGRLLVQECVEVDHQRESLLGGKDINALQVKLKRQADIREYNWYVETYRIAAYTIKEGLVRGYRLTKDVYYWITDIQKFYVAGVLQEFVRYRLPAIVTQKQYEDIGAKQKAGNLQDKTRLTGSGCAIIQQPEPDELDAKGYYKDQRMEMISTASSYIEQFADTDFHSTGVTLKDCLRANNNNIRVNLRAWLAYKAVMEMLSERVGVNLCEDLEECLCDIRLAVNRYNQAVTDQTPFQSYLSLPGSVLPEDLKLPPLKIDDLKPDKAWIKHLKERVAMGLGTDWWRATRPVLDKALLAFSRDAKEETHG